MRFKFCCLKKQINLGYFDKSNYGINRHCRVSCFIRRTATSTTQSQHSAFLALIVTANQYNPTIIRLSGNLPAREVLTKKVWQQFS